MPTLNSVYEEKSSSAPEFYCPYCLLPRPYDFKRMSKEITLYAIPLLATSEPSHVIECQVCRNAFGSQILQGNIQFLVRLAGSARRQFDKGISPSDLKQQLVSDGLKESYVEKLITLAQH